MPGSELFANASAVWKMLDEMSVNDPTGYKCFIEKQIKQGKETLSKPIVRFVIKANMKDPKRTLFVSYCEWAIVPDSQGDTSPVVVKCGEQFDLNDKTCIALAFNPNVFLQHGFSSDTTDTTSKMPKLDPAKLRAQEDNKYQLVWLGLHYLETVKKLPTMESKSVICTSVPLRPKILSPNEDYGSLQQIYDSLGYPHGSASSNGGELDKSAMSDIKKSDISLFTTCLNQPQGEGLTDDSPIILPSKFEDMEPRKTKLIEELPMENVSSQDLVWHAEVISGDGEKKQNRLRVTFDLPGVKSGSQCDLDMTAEKLCLEIRDASLSYKPLIITLPCEIDAECAEAKFSAKQEKLTVVAPIVQPNP